MRVALAVAAVGVFFCVPDIDVVDGNDDDVAAVVLSVATFCSYSYKLVKRVLRIRQVYIRPIE